MDNGCKDKEILSFQIQRSINILNKSFLNLLEDLSEEYDRYFNQNEIDHNRLPENFLNDQHFTHLRKKVLDKGGDVTRDLLQEFNKYYVRLSTNEELQREKREEREKIK